MDNPDELLTGVVEVELDLVGRGTDRLVTSELELLDESTRGGSGPSAALIGVKEDIVDIEGSSNKGLVVGDGGQVLAPWHHHRSECGDSPEALINGAKIKVDLDLVVLKSDQGKGKTGVGAVPELKRNVKSGLGKSLAGGTHLARSIGSHRDHRHQRKKGQ